MAAIDASATTPKARTAPSQARTAWGLAAPALALMVLILLVPVVGAGVLSLTNYSLGNPGFDWVGTQDYERLFTRSTYEKTFVSTFTYVVTVVPVSGGLGLRAALLVNALGRIGDISKTIYFLLVMATLLAMAIA